MGIEGKEKVIYVDEIRGYVVLDKAARRWGSNWCHLWTDPGNEAELNEMADRIKLNRKYFQNKKGFPHYDLIESKRALAVKAGAVPTSLREWIKNNRRLHAERKSES